MRLHNQFICAALKEAVICGPDIPDSASFVIDSRKVKTGDVFVALSGSRCDGHSFIKDAVNAGAAGLFIELDKQELLSCLSAEVRSTLTIIMVRDTFESLIQLARVWRAQFSCPFVGVTGSVGKTTTKELISAVAKYQGIPHIVSPGNINTRIGAATVLLTLREHHQLAILEMGISQAGEMAALADLIRPSTAVITTVAHQHMDGLGSLQSISHEKREIFKYFSHDSIGVINGDVLNLVDVSYAHPVIKFGLKMTNQVQARRVRYHADTTTLILKIYEKKASVVLPKSHPGYVMNVLAASAVATVLGIPFESIVAAVQEVVVVSGRYEQRLLKNGKGFLINDCYNANPESMKAALEAFERMPVKGKKVAILGDMLGLGMNAHYWHRQLGRFLRKSPSLTHVVFVGNEVKAALKTVPMTLSVVVVPSWRDAVVILQEQLHENSAVLVKGSRGIQLDMLVDILSSDEKSLQHG